MVAVAERVFHLYSQGGLAFKHRNLELELELPWLTSEHDDHKVRVSGFTDELDSEKLKFYLSALSNNAVNEIYLDECRTRAIATFKNSLQSGSFLFSWVNLCLV